MSELERLRNEARKKQQAAANKISRTKRQTGANLAGTQYDPRRNANAIGRYNRQQLQSYIATLNDFMRRGNQFVSGNRGAPIPKGEWARYKRIESEYNIAAAIHANSIGDLKTPLGLTVRQTKGIVPQTQGSSVYGPYKSFDRTSQDVTSVESLRTLAADLLKGLNSNYLPTKINQGRDNIKKALEFLGDTEQIKKIDALSDYQFDAFWFGTTAAEATFLRYEMEKERVAGTRKERWQDRVIESAADELGDVLDWARNDVPTTRPGRT